MTGLEMYHQLVTKAGSVERLAMQMGVHPMTARNWRKFGIPERQWDALIEKKYMTLMELYTMNKLIKKEQAKKLR